MRACYEDSLPSSAATVLPLESQESPAQPPSPTQGDQEPLRAKPMAGISLKKCLPPPPSQAVGGNWRAWGQEVEVAWNH